MNLTVDQLIEEAQEYLRLSLQEKENPVKSLVQSLVEKIIGDESGNVQRVDLNKDCPSAARERLQIAADTAKMNEKNLRASEGALKTQLEVAKRDGREDLAKELQARLDKVSENRRTNLKNMDRIDSISSDYALKYKPQDNNYDQRAHSLFLKKQREQMERRLSDEQSAEFPNPDTIDKLERRINRVDTAQKESEKWLSANDPKWLKASQEIGSDDKEASKKASEKLKGELKTREAAQKAAEKAAGTTGAAIAATPTGTTGAAAPTAATGTTGAATTGVAGANDAEEKAAIAKVKSPGDTWKTSRGAFGAMNRGGIVKYFKSEEEAKIYAGLEKGRRRSRKPPTAEKIIAGKIGGEAPEKKALAAGDFAAELVNKHLQILSETYRDSGLGKWFEGESADDTPGWDRYNSAGKRIGKCGDADEGEAYAACLSKQKAAKLGKEGISSFVRRKRAAQRKAGMGKKGQGEAGGGAEPVRVSTGIDKVKEEWSDQYKDSIDCDNPKGFSQRAHCQGRKKEMQESVSVEEMKSAIEEMIVLIKKHEKMAFEAKKAGNTAEYKKHRNIVAERSADIKTVQDMIRRAMRDRPQPITEKEEEKPYKGFVRGKNHPEGGLSRAEAKRQGIHAGIETKDEAERKGGFGKLSPKTQKRRKSFCSRMCGMKRKNTSAETAADPDSKINAALRVWGCRCGATESTEPVGDSVLQEASKNEPTNPELWGKVQDLVAGRTSSMEHGGETITGPNDGKGFDVHPSAYSNAWAAKLYKRLGGGWRSVSESTDIASLTRHIVSNSIMKKAPK